MQYQYADLGPTNPASVDRSTGVVTLNTRVFDKLSGFVQKFVKYHEEGHYIQQTSNERQADRYAFFKLAGTERNSLKKIVKTLITTLNQNKPEAKYRVHQLGLLALEYDWQHNGNQKAKYTLDKLKNINTTTTMSRFEGNITTNSNFSLDDLFAKKTDEQKLQEAYIKGLKNQAKLGINPFTTLQQDKQAAETTIMGMSAILFWSILILFIIIIAAVAYYFLREK